MKMVVLLGAIGRTEESTFREICAALGDDKPEKGNKAEWRYFFDAIRKATSEGFIEAHEDGEGKFEGAILTEAGVAELARLRGL